MAKSPESIGEASAGRILGTMPTRTLGRSIQEKGVDVSEVYQMDPRHLNPIFEISQLFEKMLGKDVA